MIPQPHSNYPPTTLPPTYSAYSSNASNYSKPPSSSTDRLPPTAYPNEYRSVSHLQNSYRSQRQIPSDLRLQENNSIGSQRYYHQQSERQVPLRATSASHAPYESNNDLRDSRRGSNYNQDAYRNLQSSQSSYNNLGHQFSSKTDSKNGDTFFTFKKDSNNQLFDLSDMSSVNYASSEQQDSVVAKGLFSAESKKINKFDAKLEEAKGQVDSTLQLPGSEVKEAYQTSINNQGKFSVESPTKLIKCLELINTPQTPPKKGAKPQADYFSNQHPYLESPEILLQQSRERFPKGISDITTKPVKTQLINDINAFNFESLGRDNDSNSIMKNNSSLKNPSYCTESPSMKYNSHPIRNNLYERPSDKEFGLNTFAAYRSQGPEESKKASAHNYYSYLSSITMQSDELAKDQEKVKRSLSSQPSIRQQNSFQEIGSRGHIEGRRGDSQGSERDNKDLGSPVQGYRKPVNSLKNILKPNISISDFDSENQKSEENNGDRSRKFLQRLQSASDKGDETIKDIGARESTEEWLNKANERASQILGRLPYRNSLTSIIHEKTEQDSTQRTAIEEKLETSNNSRRDSTNREQKSVNNSVSSRINKEERKKSETKFKGANVEVKISDLLALNDKELTHFTVEKMPSIQKEIVKEKSVQEKCSSAQEPETQGLTFVAENRDQQVESNIKTSDSNKPTFFKEKSPANSFTKEQVTQSNREPKATERSRDLSSARETQRKTEQDSIKEPKSQSYRLTSVNTRGTGGLDTSDMQYSDSQTSSNNIVCIGSRVPTGVSKEGESRQVTEEGAIAVGKPETYPMVMSQRLMESPERVKKSMRFDASGEFNEKLTILCRSLKEKDFAMPNHQTAANNADLEELQRCIMSKIEGIHNDIIEKINVLSQKIDSEGPQCVTNPQDATTSLYINHSFSEVPSPLCPQTQKMEAKTVQHQYQQQQPSQNVSQPSQNVSQPSQNVSQLSQNVSITNEGTQRTMDNASSEMYEYDSQSRTYSIRPPMPVQATNKQSAGVNTQRSAAHIENPFSNRSHNLPLNRDRQQSNTTSVTTSHNASIYVDQQALESAEKRQNSIHVKEILSQRPPKSNENRKTSPKKQGSASPTKKRVIQSKLANVVPRDLPRPLTSKSQNKLSPSTSELHHKYASQSDTMNRVKKTPGLNHSGSARGLGDATVLNLSGKSYSEKESLETELNKSWGTNIRFSAKRNSIGPKGKAAPVESSSPIKTRKSSLNSQNSERMLALFNSSPIVDNRTSRGHQEQQSKSYLLMSPEFSFPASRDSTKHLDSVSTHHGRLDSSQAHSVHSVNHEMQRLEKKLEKYLKAGNSFELEPIKEMYNSEAYFSQVGARIPSLTRIDSARQLAQAKKSEGTQSVRVLNKWQTKEREITPNKTYQGLNKAGKKNTMSSNSFRVKEKSEREDVSPENFCSSVKGRSQDKSPGVKSVNNKTKGNSVESTSGRKSFCY